MLAGFILNEKSCLWQMQQGFWIGFHLDLQGDMYYIPQDKVLKLNKSKDAMLQSKLVCARTLASKAGSIMSMGLAIAPVARLRTIPLYFILTTLGLTIYT